MREPPGPDATGLLVAGRYDVAALLGAGGSAAVFRARDVRDGTTVALRLLHAHLAADDGTARDCLRLARWVADHPHPHLAAVLDCGRTGAVTWTALELVDGEDVRGRVEADGPLPVPAAAHAVTGVLDALAHLHAHGLVHGDVSPDNVLLRPDGRAVLLDVGGTVRRDGRVLASPLSAAPEVATGGAPRPASDVYGAGVLLTMLLTGAPPYAAAGVSALLRAHATAPVPRPSASRAGLPPGLDDLVVAMLAKDPGGRPDAAHARRTLLALATPAPPATGPARTAARHGLPGSGTRPVPVPATPSPATAGHLGPAAGRTGSRTPAVAGTLVATAVVLGLVTAAVLTTRPPSTPRAAPAPGAVATTAVPSPVATAAAATAPAAPPPPVVDPGATPVAAAPGTSTVPAVAGADLATARGRLEAAGLVLAGTRDQDGASPAGTLLGAEPAEGAVLAVAAPVTLVVASGWTTVPDVARSTTAEASRLLTEAGLVPVTTPGAGSGADRAVERTYPAAGRRVAVGQDVLLAVPPATTPVPAPTPSSSP